MARPAYSFKSFVFTLVVPILDQSFTGQGNIGMGNVTFTKTTTRSTITISADGTPMTSIAAGDNGTIVLNMQQTSLFHRFLLSWSNAVDSAAANADVSEANTAVFSGTSLTDGSQHTASGVSIMKQSDKAYEAQGRDVTWTLLCETLFNE